MNAFVRFWPIAFLFVIFATTSVSGCSSKPAELDALERQDREEAAQAFVKLPNQTQIKLVAWELTHRRPSSSKFDDLLERGHGDMTARVIAESLRTDTLIVQVTMLRVFLDSPGSERAKVAPADVARAFARCRVVEGPADLFCDQLKSEWAAQRASQ